MSGHVSEVRYQPFYCEENAWHLCQAAHLAGSDPHVIVVSNQQRCVAMWSQRPARPDLPVAWDYHVLVVVDAGGWHVWDLDSRLGLSVPIAIYVDATFATVGVQPAHFDPEFRIMSAGEYVDVLRTDRSHMLDADGRWKAAPPAWPPISKPSEGSNLERLFDMTDEFIGTCTELSTLLTHLTSLHRKLGRSPCT